MNNKDTTPAPKWRFFAAFIGIGVFAVWLAWWFVLPALYPHPERQSQVGEMFGSLNTLFAGLAFAGVVIAIFLQHDELALQREELRHTRAVMDEQRAQLEAQAVSMRRQGFEGTFFKMLGLLRDLVATFPEGPMYFQQIVQDIFGRSVVAQDGTLARFDQVWVRFGPTLMPYYRTLEMTLEFARSAGNDTSFYVRLAAAQLTRLERVVLAYASYATCVPLAISEAAHRHGFFDDLPPGSFNDHTRAAIMKWIAEGRGRSTEHAAEPGVGPVGPAAAAS